MKTVTIKSKNGIHARPASQIVNTCQQFESDIYIIKDNQKADARSIMNLLGMSLELDDTVTIEAVGSDSEQAEDAIAMIIEGIDHD